MKYTSGAGYRRKLTGYEAKATVQQLVCGQAGKTAYIRIGFSRDMVKNQTGQ